MQQKYFEEGDRVKKGQKLYLIEPNEYILAAKNARATVNENRAVYKNSQIDYNRAEQLLKEDLAEVLCTLSPRERDVLRLRFGMDDGKARTLEEVGKEFNVTRERIRQIEAKALRKLRQRSRSGKLRDYIED